MNDRPLVSTKAARLEINQCGDLSLPVQTPSCSVWIMATVYSTLLYFTFKIKKKKQWQHRKDGQIDQQDCRSQSSPQEQA